MKNFPGMILRLAVLLLAVCICGCESKGKVTYQLQEETQISEGSEVTETDTEPQNQQEMRPVVYVCGAVVCPGVYELEPGSRVYQAVEAAGGFLEDADLTALNQADPVYDGQQITVLTKEEAQSMSVNTSEGVSASGKVNLNHGDKEALMTLPGIGETKAEAILSYRTQMGGFASIEELMNIAGIKQGVFNKIKDLIEV